MKLNILGTVYDYQETTAKEEAGLDDKDGYCDRYKKIIRVETDYNENSPNAIKDFNGFKQKVKRHEIIHAYFYESGMYQWSDDEMLVNWIAIQFPKLLETFKEVSAL